MYCCFQEELHRSFTEASQKLHRSFTEASQKLHRSFTEASQKRDVFERKQVLYLAQMINYISKTRLVTERTVSFMLIGHIDTLKV